MKVPKSTALALSLIALSTSAAAELKKDLFIGATIGNQWTESEIVGKSKETSSNMNVGIRAGTIINDTHRFTGTYTRATGVDKNFSDARSHLILASYDYLVPFSHDLNLTWFGGATLGASVAKSGKLGNEAQMVGGAQTGVTYSFNDSVSMDLGYRFISQDITASDDRGTYKLGDMNQVYIAVDYRF